MRDLGEDISVEQAMSFAEFVQMVVSGSANSYWTPFCVEAAGRFVVMVETPADVDLTTAEFVYVAQRQHSCRMASLPYHDFVKILDPSVVRGCLATGSNAGFDVDFPSQLPNVMLLYNTGRCGSTFFSKILSTIGQGITSLSEPDVITSVPLYEAQVIPSIPGLPPPDRNEMAQREIWCAILRSTAAWLLLYQQQYLQRSLSGGLPSSRVLVIKFRSVSCLAVDMLHQALPEAKGVMLYRNAHDTLDSFTAMILAYFPPARLMRRLHLDRYFGSGELWRVMRMMSRCMKDPGMYAALANMGTPGLSLSH
ncbi:unnamed protein product [Vitrella brassicaformis CCMP3155]|uniref:Sulfotransferase domain-containing protein n=1 Tax=Vitrella brassicaformis (strain CCMP3155) TaxID=1169540 RepID=A0A0G4EV28_VITBC|nr:unnamed protein product [Vitrella brassicaformis CCMP3155]|eukprot:CEM02461.1 unnamed protein product [Vitrella brassicaformis CCMP3155]